MTPDKKLVSSLTAADFSVHRIWMFDRGPGGDEAWVKPVRNTPVAKLTGRVVATRVVLANGQRPWALIGNVDLDNARLTRHFATVSIERDGRWFHLARYHDYDYADRGPEQLASFLGLRTGDVFPIAYDVSGEVQGEREGARGLILAEPEEKLSRAEIIALAVP